MPAVTSAPRPKWFRSKSRWLAAFVLGLLVLAVWFWPARRNFYGKTAALDVRLDVPYREGSDPKQRLDLYLPSGAAVAFPLVLFVYGGYWSPLDRRWLLPLLGTFGNVGAAFARHGVGAAIVGYRQYPEVQSGDASLDDIASGIRYAVDNAGAWGGDPRRIFVIGHSAGGHLVSLLALDPRILQRRGVEASAIAGFASLDGVFDLRPTLAAFKPEQAAVLRTLFGPDDAALAAHSPVSYARAVHPPLLFVDSTDDAPVCRDSFRHMQARLSELGSPARFVELPGLGHNELIVRIGMADDPVLPTLLDFVRGTHATAAP